jgi:endoglucanase
VGPRLVLILTLALVALATATSAAAAPWIGVRGKHLVNREGEPVRLIGMNRSGTEYSCQQGYGFFDGPADDASIATMVSWRINAVRVPLNPTCWLGINGVEETLSGGAYRRAIRAWVSRLEAAGLYVILDLHVAAPAAKQAVGIIPMADADHALDFWRSVASEFREDRAVLFDLYNEPHDVGWRCWARGCEEEGEHVGAYRATGMRQLVAAVRSTGARQPIMLGGVGWARNLDQWLEHLPEDPLNALVASNHTYDFAACFAVCRADLEEIAKHHPVVTGELGQGDCRHDYIDDYMAWADRAHVSYLAWTWNAHGGWTCRSGPSLIRNFNGAPTQFGIGFREHLRDLRG